MNAKLKAVLAVMAATLGLAAWAEGMAGVWLITTEGRQGTNTSTLTVTHDDSGYAGTLSGRRGTTEISSIAIDGDAFSFTITMQTRMGDIDLTYAGTISGDAIEGNIETPMGSRPFTGVRKVDES